MRARHITVTIERLVLDGLPLERGQAAQVKAAVAAELAALLAGDGAALAEVWTAGGALPALAAAPIEIGSEPDPAGLGSQIARSVHGGLERGP